MCHLTGGETGKDIITDGIDPRTVSGAESIQKVGNKLMNKDILSFDLEPLKRMQKFGGEKYGSIRSLISAFGHLNIQSSPAKGTTVNNDSKNWGLLAKIS